VGTCSGQPTNPALASPFAVFWDAGGAVHEVDTENLTTTSAVDINDEGIIVGYAGEDAARTPWIYNLRTQKLSVLSVPPDALDTVANAINDNGEIVGTASFAERPKARPVMWTKDTLTLRSLAGLNDFDVNASGLNNQGVIVGTARDLGPIHALVWESAAAAPLALPLPAPSVPGWFSMSGVARAINDQGRIIGQYVASTWDVGRPCGALWTSDRRPIDVGEFRFPVAINSSGRAVAARGSPSQGALLIDW
jgi:uncharacterized membrane protein